MSIDTLSNMSYTNKDFNSIYTELLEYASKLSYRWDPSSSDESDPGVVLLKLFSIIGDKDNYNIDKNILELMPASVTQLGAARQIFEQCGYTMPYYRSAEGTLQLTLVTPPPSSSAQTATADPSSCTIDLYTLPQFTMFSDIDNTIVYTSLEPVTFEVCRNSEHINKREKIKPVSAIQGIIKDYTVNNDPVISLTNIDYRNRLYFTETDIAENGIFISNVDKNFEDLRAWQRVDILELVDPGTPCFKLGIDVDSSLCYIEFPNDISTLIGKGLLIKYVRTAGLEGNVAPKYITKLFTEASFEHTSNGQSSVDQVSIDNSWITVTNPLPISNGQDPESIEDAYHSYKRVKNTFDTLVSLSDYTNHMITSKHASNGFICDRTNDIQHVYSIVSQHDGANMINKVIEKVWKDATVYVKTPNNDKKREEVEIECDALDAFDLTLYGLEYVDTVNTQEAYLQTFEIIPNYDDSHDELPCKYITYLNSDEDSIKCIQHNFAKHDKNKILMIKNKYPINATIIPEYRLTANQLSEVFSNISKNLFLNLNSKRMEFGEGTSFEVIYNAILKSDARIKSLSLEYPTYETYVVYKDDNNKYVDMRVDNDSYGGYELIDKITDIEDDTVVYVKTFKGFESIDAATAKKNPSNCYYTYDSDLAKLWNDFRAEIFAKSVLAGVTPLYLEDTQFSLGINQRESRIHTQIDKVTTNTILKGDYNNNTWSMNRDLTENENIIFTAPNYVTENQYSSYVKMIYDFPSLEGKNLIKDNIYSFGENDFIVFFWKAHADDEDYTYLKYSGEDMSKAKALTCSYTIPSKQPAPAYTELFNSRSDATDAEITKLWESVVNYFRNIIPTTGEEALTSSTTATQFDNVVITETELVSKLSSSNNFNTLTGSQTIYTKNPNTINLTDSEKGSDRFCWILNKNSISYENGTAKSVLFDATDSYKTENGEKIQERTLKSGEYLFYTNASMTSLNCLGQGTLIRREFTGEPKELSCDVIDYTQLLRYGPDALRDFWVSPASSTLKATEMQIIQLGPGSRISSITSDGTTLSTDFKIDNTPDKIYNCSITYTDGKTQTKLPEVPDGWEVYSVLNLNMSNNKPQKLLKSNDNQDAYYNQSISYLDSDPISGVHVLSDVDLSIVGGKDVDITSKNLDNTMNNPSFLSYKIQETNSDNSGITYSSEEFTCNVYIDEEGTYTKKLGDVKLFPGNYLISIQAYDKSAIDSLELTISETTVDFSQLLGNNGNYVYKLIVTEETNITFTLKVECNSVVTLLIKQFYKYTTSILDGILSLKDNAPEETSQLDVLSTVDDMTESTRSFEDSVLSMIKTLDLLDEFDYTYHVDDSVLITNPLISNTFLNKSHIYNPFTICQWNIDDVSPRIDILNNVR